jgi:hypothetical protein
MHHGPDTVDYKGRHYPRVFQAPSQFKVALSALGRGETRLDPFSDISRLPRLSLRLTTTERYLRLVLCERIVWYLEHPEEAKRLVRKNSSKNINRDEMQVNRIRLMNVLFSDAIRPILHTRNEPLHKDDMTDGMVSGQKFWSKVANEYNSDNVRYKFIAHANINVPRNLDPSKYSPITFVKAKACTSKLLSEYDGVFQRWKRSGNHEKLVETVARSIDDFIQSKVLLYMHEYASAYPEALTLYVGTLPSEVFHDSMKPPPLVNKIKGKNSVNDGMADYTKMMAQNMEANREGRRTMHMANMEEKRRANYANMIPAMQKFVGDKRKAVHDRQLEFLEAVQEAEYQPGGLKPMPPPKQLKKGQNKHDKWKQHHNPSNITSSQDTCASSIDRLDFTKEDLQAAESLLENTMQKSGLLNNVPDEDIIEATVA